MTKAQLLRMERRAIVARRREQRRVQAAKDALGLLLFVALLLTAFGIAGALDYSDRAEGLGANMLPDPAWVAGDSQ